MTSHFQNICSPILFFPLFFPHLHLNFPETVLNNFEQMLSAFYFNILNILKYLKVLQDKTEGHQFAEIF